MGLTHTKIKVINPADSTKYKDVDFLVDSGAFYSFINAKTLRELGIRPESTREFILANGKRIARKVGSAKFKFRRKIGAAPVVFGQNGDENLLGATTLESLGLMLNPLKREIDELQLRL